MYKMQVDSFTWSRWRSCTIFDKYNFACRTCDIISMKHIIKKYAVGYINGKNLFCRPKNNSVAVMFLIDDVFSWCHLKITEFEKIFNMEI